MAFAALPPFTSAEIKAIAHHQKKTLMWFALRFIVSGFFLIFFSWISKSADPSQPSTAAFAANSFLMTLHWAMTAVMFYHLFKLAETLKLFSAKWVLWLVTILAFLIGILGLIYILGAVIQANRALKAAGIRIGFFGADRASLDQFLKNSPPAA